MERLYCTINEEQARIAHDMMSMSDYKVGSKTHQPILSAEIWNTQ